MSKELKCPLCEKNATAERRILPNQSHTYLISGCDCVGYRVPPKFYTLVVEKGETIPDGKILSKHVRENMGADGYVIELRDLQHCEELASEIKSH